MSTTWFTSDLHLGHALVARLRGFGDDTEAHDMTVADRWKRHIGPNDRVWVLGDLAMSDPAHALETIGTLPGEKHLIVGNHDTCSPIHRNSFKHQREYLEVFHSVQAYARIRVQKEDVLLSHYPYAEDHTEIPRYMQYRLPDLGEWLIHGHTHDENQRRHGKQLHIGLDAWGLRPVSLAEIERMMNHE